MSLLDRILLPGTVTEVEHLTRRMRRVRIAGPALRDLAWVPGQNVRLKVGDLGSPQTWLRGLRDVLRSYSVWAYDPDGHLDLCILDHDGAGPGALWSRRADTGLPIALTRPEGRLVLRPDAPFHLFVGDETASVAFGAMLRDVPGTAQVHSCVAVSDPADQLPLPRELTWAYRNGATDTDTLLRGVRALDLPDGPGVAYVAGEARACQAARHHLVRERGWPRTAIRVKAFWAPGKRGLD
ncbi:siderophore-interacting protein [Actinomadura craniellae]|uniref:Siderophore-interacting protein n=1 Tax=Actinomadura craniellae TaxID=2231787 RepID=A0A365HAS3_9ACTN|nr:siderophore-interacting protein [Actinomadura craniellae]RAY16197.1 siderophore-interacting protein [Actinomadura craniellae]